MLSGVSITVFLLMFVAGSQAHDLLRATAGNYNANLTVRCWCPTYPNVTLCSWPESSDSPPSHYIATYRERQRPTIGGHGRVIPPGAPLPMATSSPFPSSSPSDRLWHCYLPNLKLFTDHIINITAVYPGVSRSYLTNFMLEDIIEPDAPVDIEVMSHGSRNVTVKWSPPVTWANLHIFPLQYHILYQWENRGTLKSVNVGPLKSTEVVLRTLTPGRTYTFKVCAKDLLDLGKCSTWSSVATITTPQTTLD